MTPEQIAQAALAMPRFDREALIQLLQVSLIRKPAQVS